MPMPPSTILKKSIKLIILNNNTVIAIDTTLISWYSLFALKIRLKISNCQGKKEPNAALPGHLVNVKIMAGGVQHLQTGVTPEDRTGPSGHDLGDWNKPAARQPGSEASVVAISDSGCPSVSEVPLRRGAEEAEKPVITFPAKSQRSAAEPCSAPVWGFHVGDHTRDCATLGD